MAASLSRPDPSSPASVAEASFSTARRGFQQDEVRALLVAVGAELGRLQERERQLEAELREARALAEAAPSQLDEAAVTELLGEETVRVLQTARESASQIKIRAEETAARILREANDEANRLRQETEVDVARRRQDAASDAEAEVALAKQQGREMVNEARAYRERVLADLDRRTTLARKQIEELIHGRDRLLQVFERARLVAVDVTSELRDIDTPDELVNLTPTTGPVPIMVPNQRRERLQETPAESASVSTQTPPRGEDGDEEDVDVEAVDEEVEPDQVEPDQDEEAEPGAGDEVLVEESVGGGPDGEDADVALGAAESADEPEATSGELEGTVPDEAIADDADDRDDDDVDRDELTDDELTEDELTDDELTEDELTDDELTDDELTEDELTEDELSGVGADSTPVRDDNVVSLFRGRVVVPPASGEADDRPEVPADEVGGIFARLRDELPTTDTVVRRTDEGAEATIDELDEPDDGALGDSPFSRRDEALVPLIVAAARKIKRVLADEQNLVLDTLRQKEPVTALADLVPGVDEHTARYRTAIDDELVAAAAAGAVEAGANDTRTLRNRLGRAGALDDATALMRSALIGPLRDRIQRSISDGTGDNEAITKRVRAVYREWKTQHIDSQLDDVFRFAHGGGIAVAVDPGTPMVWTIDPSEPACPDCEDNSLAGAVPAGEPFPTGHAAAPAHPGCRCLVLPAG